MAGVPGGVDVAGTVFDPEVGVVAGAGEGDAGDAEELGWAIEGERVAVEVEGGGTTVAEGEPIVAGGGGEQGGDGRGVEDGGHAGGQALLELQLGLVEGEGFGVDGEGALRGDIGCGLFHPGAVDGVLVGAGLGGDCGRSATDSEGQREEDEQTAHVRRIHRRG